MRVPVTIGVVMVVVVTVMMVMVSVVCVIILFRPANFGLAGDGVEEPSKPVEMHVPSGIMICRLRRVRMRQPRQACGEVAYNQQKRQARAEHGFP
jgi:hypothetical protein